MTLNRQYILTSFLMAFEDLLNEDEDFGRCLLLCQGEIDVCAD